MRVAQFNKLSGLMFAVCFSVLSGTAFAACAALPTGTVSALRMGGEQEKSGVHGGGSTNHPAGTLAWDGAAGKPVYCDGDSWLTLASGSGGGGSGLTVYDPTGSALGAYLSVDANNIYYADSANNNEPKTVARGINTSLAAIVYFSQANCTGTIYTNSGSGGYSCTGAANCKTKVVASQGNFLGAVNVWSIRQLSGDCHTYASAQSLNYMHERYVPICVNAAGNDKCQIR